MQPGITLNVGSGGKSITLSFQTDRRASQEVELAVDLYLHAYQISRIVRFRNLPGIQWWSPNRKAIV